MFWHERNKKEECHGCSLMEQPWVWSLAPGGQRGPMNHPGTTGQTTLLAEKTSTTHVSRQEEMELSSGEEDEGSQAPGPMEVRVLWRSDGTSTHLGAPLLPLLCSPPVPISLFPEEAHGNGSLVVLQLLGIRESPGPAAGREVNQRADLTSLVGSGPDLSDRGWQGGTVVKKVPLGQVSWLLVVQRRGKIWPLARFTGTGPKSGTSHSTNRSLHMGSN